MNATEVTAAAWKIVLCLAGSLAFVAIALWGLLNDPGPDADMLQFGGIFFGFCALGFLWLLIRPQRLLLDDEGFTLLGGFVRSPRKECWGDIDEFLVCHIPKGGGKVVAYNYKPGVRPSLPIARSSRPLGVDAVLPRGWARSPEKLVEDLNARRLRAKGGERPLT